MLIDFLLSASRKYPHKVIIASRNNISAITKIHAKQHKERVVLIFQCPGAQLSNFFFWEIAHDGVSRKRENYNLLFWEQSNARRILIKFIKQITQLLRETGVHLPVLQIDLCRDASWTVVKAKLQSSADGLLSLVRKIWWRSNSIFPSRFLFLATVIEETLLCLFSASSATSHPHPLPPLLCMQAMIKSERFVQEASPGWSHSVPGM